MYILCITGKLWQDFPTRSTIFPEMWNMCCMTGQKIWLMMKRKIWHLTSQTNIQISWKNSWNIYMTMVFMYVVLIKIPGNLSWMEIIHWIVIAVIAMWLSFLNSWKLGKTGKKIRWLLPYSSIVKFFADPKNGTLGNK